MGLPPVTRERVEGICKELEVIYDVDDDGDIAAGWNDVVVWIHVKEKVLTFIGYWRGKIEASDDSAKAKELCNDFNANSHGPKCYVEATGAEGNPETIKMEMSQWTENGMTDEQLKDYCALAFGMIMNATESMQSNLSHLVDWEDSEG